MQKHLAGAAFAATLSLMLVPALGTAPVATAQPVFAIETAPAPAVAALRQRERLPQVKAKPAKLAPGHGHSHDDEAPKLAPGQERADFNAWLARSPANRDSVRAFRSYLAANGVDDVLPIWQLVRTSSSWRDCGAERFEVAPRDKWGNIVQTLKFVDRNVVPQVGKVQALSGYRNASLNACSNGAPASAHRMFFALDLAPADADVTRGELIQDVCAAHAREGRSFKTGLGFYNGVRFHVDSSGFRKWGPDGSGATSPCVTRA